jgi:hypothetical protein
MHPRKRERGERGGVSLGFRARRALCIQEGDREGERGSVWKVERGGHCAHRAFSEAPRIHFPVLAGYGLDDGVAWISEHLRVN